MLDWITHNEIIKLLNSHNELLKTIVGILKVNMCKREKYV